MNVTPQAFTLEFSAAAGEELILIGDIHGADNLLDALLATAADLERPAGTRRKLIFLGDLIDRGPASLRCLDLAIESKKRVGAHEVIGLIGNHEQMLKIALAYDGTARGDVAVHLWIRNGGRDVIMEMLSEQPESQLDVRRRFGEARLAWLDGLVSHHISGEILAVHGGVNPNLPLDKFLAQSWDVDLRDLNEDDHWAWVRGPFLDHTPAERGHHGFFVIHGHSTPQIDLIPTEVQIERARLNLDGGTYATGVARMARVVGNQVTLFEAS
jgi:serine/threonine protein phosphatase 1